MTEEDHIERDRVDAEEEFNRLVKAWFTLQFNWIAEFPEHEFSASDPPLQDLLTLDVGIIYRRLMSEDPDGDKYGLFPEMARSSFGQIGALNAESFCERSISAANIICTPGNTTLGDDMIDMMVTLRMNKDFMEYMASQHMTEMLQEFDASFNPTPNTVTVDNTAEEEEVQPELDLPDALPPFGMAMSDE
jgi:hypothetical protein